MAGGLHVFAKKLFFKKSFLSNVGYSVNIQNPVT